MKKGCRIKNKEPVFPNYCKKNANLFEKLFPPPFSKDEKTKEYKFGNKLIQKNNIWTNENKNVIDNSISIFKKIEPEDKIDVDFITVKIKLLPDSSQKKWFKETFGATNYLYNKMVDLYNPELIKDNTTKEEIKRKVDEEKLSKDEYYELLKNRTTKPQTIDFTAFRDAFVTENPGSRPRKAKRKKEKKIYPEGLVHNNFPDWMYKLSKYIRQPVVKKFQTAVKNIVRKSYSSKPNHKLHHKRKIEKNKSFGIEQNQLKFSREIKNLDRKKNKKRSKNRTKRKKLDGKIIVKDKRLKTPIRTKDKRFANILNDKNEKESTFVFDGLDYWLHVLIPRKNTKEKKQSIQKKNQVGIDPGVRSVVTCHDYNSGFEYKTNKEKLYKRFDKLDQIHAKYNSNSCEKYRREMRRLDCERNRIHVQIAKDLANNYKDVVIGKFNSHELVQKRDLHKNTRRTMNFLAHHKLRERLKLECSKSDSNVYFVDESWTSRTCCNCGDVNHNLGAKEMYNCTSCFFIGGRDLNAACNMNKLIFGSEVALATPLSEWSLNRGLKSQD